MRSSLRSKTLLDCASKCLNNKIKESNCNAFKFNEENKNCDLAQVFTLDLIKDPLFVNLLIIADVPGGP